MSSGSSESADEEVEVLFEQEVESSEDPPAEEWSSLLCFLKAPKLNEKQLLFDEGLYQPPSAEICTKYIALSDSSVFRHPYYPYPAVLDPGIEEALLKASQTIIYADDGQELYLALCKEMGEPPCRIFYDQLLKEAINLRYYGVSPLGVRPMAMALTRNRNVQVVDFTDNFLSLDACFHLGEMFIDNYTITELILSGCKVGPDGVKRLVANLKNNRTLRKLDLAKNIVTDDGVEYIGQAILKGASFCELNLSYNNLSAKTAATLAEAVEFNNKLTHLDLSWNSLLVPRPMEILCNLLTENKWLVEVNFSWNALTTRFNTALKYILTIPNITNIYLNNNKLCDEAIAAIGENLQAAKKLVNLDLSYNPLTVADAKLMLKYMRLRKVKLQNLYMDGVIVDEAFVQSKINLLALKHRKDSIVTHGYVTPKFVIEGVDPRDLLLSRAQVVCNKPKKRRVDVGLLILELQKLMKNEPIPAKELPRYIKSLGAFQMNDDLIEEFGSVFPGPKRGKFKTVSVALMADYVKRKWPDTVLPPTPPPPPAPIEVAPPPKGKGKEKDKKGKKK